MLKLMLMSLLPAIGIIPGPISRESHSTVTREFWVEAIFSDATTKEILSSARPQLEKTQKLVRSRRNTEMGSANDFRLSFNCRVTKRNDLDDCRLIRDRDKNEGGKRLMGIISPLLMLSSVSAKQARDEAYRVQIDAALNSFIGGVLKRCAPPFCLADELTPPRTSPL
ncbi:MAG: hypothetical protein EOO77_15210 [Oxalobacteraceae bacterium]|nr:MAG: hypothetical protein EOO77_15210 [Oxalobacteraceae bacterium]